MTKLEYAIEYAGRGWKVVALHTPGADGVCSCHKRDCSSIGKHPRTMHGLKDATVETATINRWWGMWPDANIGVITGAESGFVVLDVDTKNGGTEALTALVEKHGKLKQKVYANTGGGGWHLIFQHPGGHWPNTQSGPNKPSRIGAGLDFRGDGGYIVAPGSTHVSGVEYSWGEKPNGHLPDMPEWLKDKLRDTATSGAVSVSNGNDPIISGDRHHTLLAFAGLMRRKGMSAQSILAALRVENQHRCNPPKDDAEIVRIAEFVGAKEPSDPVLLQQQLETVEDVPRQSEGLFTLDAYEADLDNFRANGLPKGLHPGWDSVADLYTVMRRSMTMVTGSPTAGKSHWMNALAVNMMLKHNWKFAVASPEFTPPAYFYSRFMETFTGAPFYHGPTTRMNEEVYQIAKDYLRSHLYFIEARGDEPLTVPYVLSMAKRAREEYGVDGLILDPWAKFAHAKADSMNETEYVRRTVNQILHVSKTIDLHTWLVVHPKMVFDPKNPDGAVVTPYALPGSAHWFNLAENIISLYRRKSERTNRVEVHVQKIKPHYIGQEGMCALYFDKVTGQYFDSGMTPGVAPQPDNRNEPPEF